MSIKKKTTIIKSIIITLICSIIFGTLYSANEKEKEPVHLSGSFKKATFAGGCFWCMQPPFDMIEGVVSTSVGYTDGALKNPTYQQVCTGTTGHTEAIEVNFDPTLVTYTELLEIFWRNIDPTVKNRQFVDIGTQYRAGIYYHSDTQKNEAIDSREKLQASNIFEKDIVTEIKIATTFYHAEEYHQKYYKKSPVSYYRYRYGSGRDKFLEKHWGEK